MTNRLGLAFFGVLSLCIALASGAHDNAIAQSTPSPTPSCGFAYYVTSNSVPGYVVGQPYAAPAPNFARYFVRAPRPCNAPIASPSASASPTSTAAASPPSIYPAGPLPTISPAANLSIALEQNNSFVGQSALSDIANFVNALASPAPTTAPFSIAALASPSALLTTDLVATSHNGQNYAAPISQLLALVPTPSALSTSAPLSYASIVGALASPLPPSAGGVGPTSGFLPISSGDLLIGFGDSITASGGGSTFNGPAGSSTSGGSGGAQGTPYVPTGTGWLDLLGEQFGAEVSNLGIGGTCLTPTSGYCGGTSSGGSRYQNSYTASNPGFAGLISIKGPAHTWAFIMYGTNDVYHGDTGVTVSAYQSYYQSVTNYLLSQGYLRSHIIISPMIPLDPGLTTQSRLSLLPQFNQASTQIALTQQFPTSHSFEAMVACWSSLVYAPAIQCTSDGLHPSALGNQILENAIASASFANTMGEASAWTSASLLSSLPNYAAVTGGSSSSATAPPQTSSFTSPVTATVNSTYALNAVDTSGQAAGVDIKETGGTGSQIGEAKILVGGAYGPLSFYDATNSLFDLQFDSTGSANFSNGTVHIKNLQVTGTCSGCGGGSGGSSSFTTPVSTSVSSTYTFQGVDTSGNGVGTDFSETGGGFPQETKTFYGVVGSVAGIASRVFSLYDATGGKFMLTLNAAGDIGVFGRVVSNSGVCPGDTTDTNTGALPCLYAGTGAPTFSAPSGSRYMRADGTANAREYVNTSAASTSGTTWSAETTP